jgi:N-acetylornithine carbamoyltransferase
MKQATSIAALGSAVVDRILQEARANKGDLHRQQLTGKLLGMLFFNPSLRTRASFEAVMLRGGGHALVLEAGNTWKLETETGAIMDRDCPEHLRDAAPVLSRYVDALAIRTFAGLTSDDLDHRDQVIRAFEQHAGVPVISMESAREHPCQGLADLMTIEEQFGSARRLPVALTWAPHIKPLPKAVPNSFLLTAAMRGCDIRIAHPPGFELHASILGEANEHAAASGGRIGVFHNQADALRGARVIYAKAWGPTTSSHLGAQAVREHDDWMLAPEHLRQAVEDAIFLHCLPVRRNVEVADAVLDGPQSRVVDEAENRFHVQRALLEWIFS